MNEQQIADHLDRLRNDIVFFARAVWEDRKLDKVAPLSDIEEDIIIYAAGLHKTAAGRLVQLAGTNRGVLAPRGVGKTHIVLVVAAWRLFRDPNRKILIPSKSETHAKKAIRLLREWINNVWFLKHLTPRADQVDSATKFEVGPAVPSLQPSVTAIGIDGQLEGNRAHSIFPDDVETEGNTKTLEAREALDARVKEFKDILYPNRPHDDGGPVDPVEIVYIGTYHHEESVYGKLSERGYSFRTWTIAAPQTTDKILNLAPIIQAKLDNGQLRYTEGGNYHLNPVFPHRFPADNIAEKMAEGRIRFSMQHMLLRNLGETNRYPLRTADLIVMDVHRDKAPVSVLYGTRDHNGSTEIPYNEIPHDGFAGNRLYRPFSLDSTVLAYTGTKAFVDPAGRGDDRTGLAIVSHLAGMLFIKGVYGLEGGSSSERLSEIAHLCRLHGAREIFVEDNIDVFGTYVELLEVEVRRHFVEPNDPEFPDGWKASVERRRSTGQKELRIVAALEPAMSTHRVVIDRRALLPLPNDRPEDSLAYQITRLTKEPHSLKEDGKIDALASCVKEWQHALRLAPDAAASRQKQIYDQRKADAWKRKIGLAPSTPVSFIKPR